MINVNKTPQDLFSPKKYKIIIFLCVMFLVCFPKGGFKLAGIPITWGYILLALLGVISIFGMLFGNVKYISKSRLIAIAGTLPFQILILCSLIFNGQEYLGMTISLIINFVVFPWLFIVFFGYYFDRLDYSYLFKLLKRAIFFISVYGIFLFFYKFSTGGFIEIPFLTVNIDDAGLLETKHIDRDGFFKLISTYNNGNLYGAALLILLPLYEWIETSRIKKYIVKFSLILTLSRTVWIGLVFYELIRFVYIKKVRITTIVKIGFSASFLGLIIYQVLKFIGRDITFLFDKNLGGRIDQFDFLHDVTFLPSIPFVQIQEIVYISILKYFGVLGLIFFILYMTIPLIIHLFRISQNSKSEYKHVLVSGIITYLVIAGSDGAIQLIPVMAFYWFIASLLLSSNSSFTNYHKQAQNL